MTDPTFDDILNETAAVASTLDAAMLDAAIKRDEAMMKFRSIELAIEHMKNRMEHGPAKDFHGGDLIRLSAGIHRWVTKDEITKGEVSDLK